VAFLKPWKDTRNVYVKKTEELVESEPGARVDFGEAIFAEATDELVATTYEDERTRVYFRDKAWETDYGLLKGELPGKEINLASSTADDRLWLIAASGDTDPGARYLFDRRTKTLALQYKVRERIPREHMAPMKAVRYLSSDGLEIPAFLTLPKGVPAKSLPAIVLPHGGPWARDGWGFGNLTQFLAKLRDPHQDPAPRGPGTERPAGQEGGVGPDRDRPARPRLSGRVHRGS
jgi:dipeptidyl aminopeptidase/acylaminoacyl peptidase